MNILKINRINSDVYNPNFDKHLSLIFSRKNPGKMDCYHHRLFAPHLIHDQDRDFVVDHQLIAAIPKTRVV